MKKPSKVSISPSCSKLRLSRLTPRVVSRLSILSLALCVAACDDAETYAIADGLGEPVLDEAGEDSPVTSRSLEQDADGDGLIFADELQLGTDPDDPDSDGDGWADGEELQLGFDPLVDDSFDDADEDRYPNIFETTHGSDPFDPASIPYPTYVIDPATGDDEFDDNIFSGIQEALNRAHADDRSYPIVGLVAGIHEDRWSVRVTQGANRASPLIIGLEGAENTIIDQEARGDRTFNNRFSFYKRAVISSLTLRNFRSSVIQISGDAASGSRVVDIIAYDNDILRGLVKVSGDAEDVKIISANFENNRPLVPTISATLYVSGPAEAKLINSVFNNPGMVEIRTLDGGIVTQVGCTIPGEHFD